MTSVTSASGTSLIPANSTDNFQLHGVDTAEGVHDVLLEAAPGDLIVWDVDEVLVTNDDVFLKPAADDLCFPIFKEIFYPLHDPENTALYGEMISQTTSSAVDEKIFDTIRMLQRKGCQMMCLTSLIPGAGPCGRIRSMEERRYNELVEYGVDFKGHFDFHNLELELPEKNGRRPVFRNGILYARPHGKGEVLDAFLKKSGIRPNKIWFIDDNKLNVDRVKACAEKNHIPYVGIHYLHHRSRDSSFDYNLGKFQFEYFAATQIWLNDQQAKDYLENNPPMYVRIEDTAYTKSLYARKGNFTDAQNAFDYAKLHRKFHYGFNSYTDFTKFYTSDHWAERKLYAIPRTATSIAQAISHMAFIVFLAIRDQNQAKYQLFYTVRCMQEGLGHLISLFHDRLGLYLVQESKFQRSCYDSFAINSVLTNESVYAYPNRSSRAYISRFGVQIDTNASKITLAVLKNVSKAERAQIIKNFLLDQPDSTYSSGFDLHQFLENSDHETLSKYTLEDLILPRKHSRLQMLQT